MGCVKISSSYMEFKLFPAFFDNPAKIRFSEQEANETIELFLRRHAIVNVPWIITALIAIILPVILIQLDQMFALNFIAPIPTSILAGGLVIYYLIIIGYVLEQFLHWYFNIYIVTNIHIVDVNFDSLLFRNITEIALKDIESVSSSIKGFFGSLFNFGNVNIETAATSQASIFEKVPKPDQVADRIEDLRQLINGGGP